MNDMTMMADALLLYGLPLIFGVCLVFIASVAVHELGHAVAAVLVGYRVQGFVVGRRFLGRRGGSGRPLTRHRVATVAGPRSGQPSGWRLAVFASGGMVANVVVAVVAGLVLVTQPWPPGLLQPHAGAREFYLFCGSFLLLWAAIVNLVLPIGDIRSARTASDDPTDGQLIRSALRRPDGLQWVEVGPASVDLDLPLTQVWDLLTDPARLADYESGVQRSFWKPGQPVGAGGTVVAEFGPEGGPSTHTRELPIIEFEPPTRLVQGVPGQERFRVQMRLEALSPTSTRLTHSSLVGFDPMVAARLTPEHLAQGAKVASAGHARLNEAIRQAVESRRAATGAPAVTTGPEPVG